MNLSGPASQSIISAHTKKGPRECTRAFLLKSIKGVLAVRIVLLDLIELVNSPTLEEV